MCLQVYNAAEENTGAPCDHAPLIYVFSFALYKVRNSAAVSNTPTAPPENLSFLFLFVVCTCTLGGGVSVCAYMLLALEIVAGPQ